MLREKFLVRSRVQAGAKLLYRVSATALLFWAVLLATRYLSPRGDVTWVYPLHLALGVGAFCVLVWGPRVVLGVLAGGVLFRLSLGSSLEYATAVSFDDALTILLVWFLMRSQANVVLGSIRRSLAVLWAGLAGAALWAVLYTLTLRLTTLWLTPQSVHAPPPLGVSLQLVMSWTGASVPVVVTVHFAMTVRGLSWRKMVQGSHGGTLELIGLAASMVAALALVFFTFAPPILVVAPMTWAVVRFHQVVSAACVFSSVVAMTMVARLGRLGFDPGLPLASQVLYLQAINLVSVLLVLVFGAIVADREVAMRDVDLAFEQLVATLDEVTPLRNLPKRELKPEE